MTNKSGLVGLLFVLLFFGKNTFSQDIHFSQFTETPISLNPALNSTLYDTRVIANFRSQWASVASPYQTYGVSIEKSIRRNKKNKTYFGAGLSVYNDKAGDAQMGTTSILGSFDVILKTGERSKFSAGVATGVNLRTLNPSKLKWESQFDGFKYNSTLASGETVPSGSYISMDFGGGVNWHFATSEKYITANDGVKADIGASVFHFNRPKYSYINGGNDKLYMKYNLHASFDIGLPNSSMAILPSIVYMRQGPSQQINGGLLLKYIIQDQSVYTNLKSSSAISFGAYYRLKDAIIPTMFFQFNSYAFGVSYDVNLSSLSTASKAKGGVEVCLKYNISPGFGATYKY